MRRKQDKYQDYEDYEEYARRRRSMEMQEEDAEYISEDFDEEEEWEEYEEYEEDPRPRRIRKERPAESKRRPEKRRADTRCSPKRQPENRRPRRKFPRLLLVVLLILLVVTGVPLGMVAARFGEIHQIKDHSGFSKEVKSTISENALASKSMKDYTNIALFGVDSREEELLSGNNRSDIMIVLSINKKTGDCRLLSIYRDTYLNIGADTYTKANAAYAYGGPQQAVQMLNTNFDLNITDFVTVGFGGLADLIDAVGGVEIEVEEEEIHGINDYQSTMAQALGRDFRQVTAPGRQTLTGLQAVAYCRIRYTAGDDFKRTERQREVLTQTFNKAKKLSPTKLNAITTMVFNECATSMTLPEALGLVVKAPTFDILDTAGCPKQELRTTGMVGDQACVIPKDLASNVRWVHEYLFGETSYQVSDKVLQISEQVAAKSGVR